jgi:hypothetical protein
MVDSKYVSNFNAVLPVYGRELRQAEKKDG